MKTQVQIREIEFESNEYREGLEIRADELRRPMGLEFTPEELERDVKDTHVAAFLEGRIVGGLILTHTDSETLQIRQVAVSKACQGQQIGQALMNYAENWARERQYRSLWLKARETVIRFYENLGYESMGPGYIALGIAHRSMSKRV